MATIPTSTQRMTLAQTMTRRRLQRSSRAPANGPMIEYGSSSTTKPSAISDGSVCRSGLNKTSTANAPWNAPSPNELSTRTNTRRRSPLTCQRCRSPRTEGLAVVAPAVIGSSVLTVERYARTHPGSHPRCPIQRLPGTSTLPRRSTDGRVRPSRCTDGRVTGRMVDDERDRVVAPWHVAGCHPGPAGSTLPPDRGLFGCTWQRRHGRRHSEPAERDGRAERAAVVGFTHLTPARSFRRRPGADVGGDVPRGVSERYEPQGARRGGGRDGPSCAGGS